MAGFFPSASLRVRTAKANPATLSLVDALRLDLANATNAEGLNMTISVDASNDAQTKATGVTMTVEVDGLVFFGDNGVQAMLQGVSDGTAFVQLDAGYLDVGGLFPTFFGSLDEVGYTFTGGRTRWRFSAQGLTPDILSMPVHIDINKQPAGVLFLNAFLDAIEQQTGTFYQPDITKPTVGIRIERSPIADILKGDFSRIAPPPGFVPKDAFDTGDPSMPANGPVQFNGTAQQALFRALVALRTVVRNARGVELNIGPVFSANGLEVILADFGSGISAIPEGFVTLGTPDVISGGPTFRKKPAANEPAPAADGSSTDTTDQQAATASSEAQPVYELVIKFDPRVTLGMVIEVDGSHVNPPLPTTTFTVQSYTHDIGSKSAWRTTLKGPITVVPAPAVIANGQA